MPPPAGRSPRERGLAAAVRLVLDEGTADLVPLGLHELCAKVGLSPTSFYRAFDSVGSFHKNVAGTMLRANAKRVWKAQTNTWIAETHGAWPDVCYAIAAWLEQMVYISYLEPWAWGGQPEIHDGLSDHRVETARRYTALTGYVTSESAEEDPMPKESTPAAFLFLNDANLMTSGLSSTMVWVDIDGVQRETSIFTAMLRGLAEGMRQTKRHRFDPQHAGDDSSGCASEGCDSSGSVSDGCTHEHRTGDGGSEDQQAGTGNGTGPGFPATGNRLDDFVEDLVRSRRSEIAHALASSDPAPAGDSIEVRVLRQRFIEGVLAEAFPNPLRNLTMYKVAQEASMSPSTLSYQFADAADMQWQTFAELLALVRTDPTNTIINTLEAAVLEGESANQIIARYLRASSKQLAEDPMYPFLVGGSAKRSTVELDERYSKTVSDLGRGFAMPLRVALSGTGLDLRRLSRTQFDQLVGTAVLTGASAQFLTKDRYRYTARGIRFEAGGLSLATTLWLLLDMQDSAPGANGQSNHEGDVLNADAQTDRVRKGSTVESGTADCETFERGISGTGLSDQRTSEPGNSERGAVRGIVAGPAPGPNDRRAEVRGGLPFDVRRQSEKRDGSNSQRRGEHDYPRKAGLAAAADLALSLGPGDFIPLSVAEVCAAAGTGASAFYRAFGSAEAFREVAASALLKHRLDGPEKLRTYVDSMTPHLADDWIAFCHGLVGVTQTHLDRDSHMQTWAWARNPYVANAIAAHVDDVVSKTVDPQLRLFERKGRRSRLEPKQLITACRRVNDAWVVTRSVLDPLTWTDVDGLERTTEVHSLGIRAMLEALLVEIPIAEAATVSEGAACSGAEEESGQSGG